MQNPEKEGGNLEESGRMILQLLLIGAKILVLFEVSVFIVICKSVCGFWMLTVYHFRS